MDATWDPERLRLVGSVLTRYAEHLAPGHRIRLGMEGDPCAVYRAADDAPGATVLDVTRDGDVVRFRAQRDDTGEVIERSNRDVGADMLWEIHPDYLATFRAHVEASEGASDDDAYAGLQSKVESQLSDFASRLATLEDSVRDDYRSSETSLARKFEEAEAANRAFRETMASTVRALAGDLMRTARGEGIEFAHQYADRYDLAVAERATFRGDKGKEEDDDADADERVHSRYQGEKYDFEESSQLSD